MQRNVLVEVYETTQGDIHYIVGNGKRLAHEIIPNEFKFKKSISIDIPQNIYGKKLVEVIEKVINNGY